MSERPRLLLDLGNSHLKYTWFDHTQALSEIKSKVISMECLGSLLVNKPDVWLCSVKSAALTTTIIHEIESTGLNYFLAESRASEFGIQNSYRQVKNMGSDRWMAIIASQALTDKDVIVIDAGTAITCDFIVNKQHLGGWIAPGLSMLRSTVVANTNRVFDFSDTLAQILPGQDTTNCVANGALAQILGMVMQATVMMQKYSKNFAILLTGGDRTKIAHQIDNGENELVIYDNLVLIGLARISHKA